MKKMYSELESLSQSIFTSVAMILMLAVSPLGWAVRMFFAHQRRGLNGKSAMPNPNDRSVA